MNCQDFLKALPFIQKFADVDRFKGLADFSFSAKNMLEEGHSVETYYSDRIADMIAILAADSFASNIEFRTERNDFTKPRFESEWRVKIGTGLSGIVPHNVIAEAHGYELYSELMRKIIMSYMSQLNTETIELRRQDDHRWSSEKYTPLAKLVAKSGQYIVSPKVAAILNTLKGLNDVYDSKTNSSILPLMYTLGAAKIYVDHMAIFDYVFAIPDNIVVTLDPDVYIHRERNPEREFGFYINRPFSLSFRAKSKLYKIVEVCEVQVELGAGIMVGDA